MKEYHEELIEEIIKLVSDNIYLLYNFNSNALINLKKHCSKNVENEYKSLPYIKLISFVEEALSEIFNADYLYDFRELE